MYPDPDRKRRFGAIDLILILAVLAAGAFVWHRVSDVLAYNWNWAYLPGVLFRETAGGYEPNLLLTGFLTTIRLSLWAMLLASLLGGVLGMMGARRRLLPRLATTAYVGLIRNIPPLVFVFVFFFFISSQVIPALGISRWARDLSPLAGQAVTFLAGPHARLENFIAGVLSLAMFEAAYIAVITRAGIQAVPEAQIEAARSLGLTSWQTFRLVVFPQALRKVTPPLANQFISLVKDSAIVSLISVQELTFTGAEIAVSSQRRFETYIVVAALYFILCFGLSRLFATLERRQAANGRS
ncbi:amino acid ABC transporter permease [Salipiger aestuarii]|uniref:Polar amino acid transport system permease protein n=1 Tax=Salipiger aestuarii TaxID=568098 RepID=A0A327Z1C2_9RHOB|nr:amino acid ABC transporter permease [Salipiger aestuarii]EIE49513.1 Amino acid ABC transporter, permease protein, 3-TM region, His/Glu/Gln/Arg/opine [Citreicella sp. 357]KAA8610110.1 amino acid ABC transporter permease [Salipiger aestuarii]KAA8616083.1 amino acid ABC transporter permease [Salipiger aestuarii]KAB2543309.1 amino acid ABC transporter permease [Salipiger aestuarii]RAK24029.1 polar amino acid transport system permease protein [Salipiger aestuarii]